MYFILLGLGLVMLAGGSSILWIFATEENAEIMSAGFFLTVWGSMILGAFVHKAALKQKGLG